MFKDVFNLTSRHKNLFDDTVRDAFGRSIVTDVFEPMIQNIEHLQRLDDSCGIRIAEIDQLLVEIRSMGISGHEW